MAADVRSVEPIKGAPMLPSSHLQSQLIQTNQAHIAHAAELARRNDAPSPARRRLPVFVVGSPVRAWIGRQLRFGRSPQRKAA